MAAATAFDRMTGQLRDLKAAFADAGVQARITRPGTTLMALQISDPAIEITCRTRPADSQWWLWSGPQPLAPAGDLAAAIQAIQDLRAAR
jgi:hypothetical protein